MTDLEILRTHARTMAEPDSHRASCQVARDGHWGPVIVQPDPACAGACITDAERDLWTQIADEIDEYLAPDDQQETLL